MTRTAAARAPGRVNLIGEHTDYNAGLCLPIALPHDTLAVATTTEEPRVRISSEQQPDSWTGALADCGPGGPRGWVSYVAGVLWALEQDGYDVPTGLDLHVTSTVPLGAGLSSSAALEVSVAVAVHALTGRDLDLAERTRLVEVCRRAETEVVGAPTGGLDQNASLLCDVDSALLLDFADASLTPIPLGFSAADLVVTVIDTRVSHALTDGDYGSRRRECESAAERLGVTTLRETDLDALSGLDDDVLRRRARHVVSENRRVRDATTAIARGDWERLGALFSASHVSLRDDFEVSCPELDLAVAAALGAGALGARMTGGGFGGSAIALVPRSGLPALRAAVDTAFAAAGHDAPAHLDAPPSAAARVVPRRP
ncbi:galactokinase [Nocardioides sp.]|uniref:galactokinase n=1 Tax=Nocardioides sp. TaxID=35761 RepID=UPI002B27B446|nr:galactokinase [Nocardioides sp.]